MFFCTLKIYVPFLKDCFGQRSDIRKKRVISQKCFLKSKIGPIGTMVRKKKKKKKKRTINNTLLSQNILMRYYVGKLVPQFNKDQLVYLEVRKKKMI